MCGVGRRGARGQGVGRGGGVAEKNIGGGDIIRFLSGWRSEAAVGIPEAVGSWAGRLLRA